METIKKRKILIGVILLLLVINISALASFMYNNYTKQKRYNEIRKTQEQVRISGIHKYLKEELQLNDDQVKVFNKIGQSNFQKSREIAIKLDEKRVEFIAELTAENPDNMKLDSISREIGNLHYELKLNTVQHYNEFKKLCNSEQQKSLEKLFIKMSEREDRHSMGRPDREGPRNRNIEKRRNNQRERGKRNQ